MNDFLCLITIGVHGMHAVTLHAVTLHRDSPTFIYLRPAKDAFT